MSVWIKEQWCSFFCPIGDTSIAKLCLSDDGFGREEGCHLFLSERWEVFSNVRAYFFDIFTAKLPIGSVDMLLKHSFVKRDAKKCRTILG